ncbi:unnamed protein product [Orchesella dallaii]|uniref:Uncharacterized protein n=1 Tax=Orchesella dallaii TaxID=48710 RepID=A0ABP1RPH8_9HEXA
METSTSSTFYQNTSKIELYKKVQAQQPTKFPIMVGSEDDFGMTSTSAVMQTGTTGSVRVPWTNEKANDIKQSTKTDNLLTYKHENTTSIGRTAVKSEDKKHGTNSLATNYLDNSSTTVKSSTTYPPKPVNLTIAISSNGTTITASFNLDVAMSIKPDQQKS